MEENYKVIGPGTAGIAQRIYSGHDSTEFRTKEEIKGLYALMHNDLLTCNQNQY